MGRLRSYSRRRSLVQRRRRSAGAAQCCPATRLLWQDRLRFASTVLGDRSARYYAAAMRSPDGHRRIGCREATTVVHADPPPSATHSHTYDERHCLQLALALDPAALSPSLNGSKR